MAATPFRVTSEGLATQIHQEAVACSPTAIPDTLGAAWGQPHTTAHSHGPPTLPGPAGWVRGDRLPAGHSLEVTESLSAVPWPAALLCESSEPVLLL